MRCLLAALILFFAVSCKEETKTSDSGSNYPEQAVGANKNGVYTILNTDEIAKSWEHNLEGNPKLTSFEIVKSKTEGDVVEDFYMLVARTEDGVAKVASLLELKGDKFYFMSTGHNDSELYLLVICKGQCDTGCLPVARIRDGVKNLVCSSCADCLKGDIGVR